MTIIKLGGAGNATPQHAEANEHANSTEQVDNQQAQPFPLDCLGEILRAMTSAVCKTERTPSSLAGCCALGILSGSIGAGLQVQSGTNRWTRGNVYLLASAESGTGKSEVFRHFAKPFLQFEAERLEAWKNQTLPGLLAEQRVLQCEVRQLEKVAGRAEGGLEREDIRGQLEKKLAALADVEDMLRAPALTCEDVTSERLAGLLAHNGEQLASLSADAGAIVNVLLGRYSKLDRTDEGVYLKAFSGDYCKVDRQSREPVLLQSPCLAALWLTQPDKLETLLSEKSLTDGGLIPRLLACHTNCEPLEIIEDTPAIPASVAMAYADLIRDLLETYRLASETRTIHHSPEALRAMNAHHNAIVKRRRGDLKDVTTFAARWTEQAWRIAVCLHAAEHGSTAHNHALSLDTAQRAITLADWFAGQQLEILQAGRTQAKLARIDKLSGLIVANYSGKATLRDLKKNNGFEAAEVKGLAAAFPNLLKIERHESGEAGGRPSETVSIPKS